MTTRPLRVLQLSDLYPPAIGGTERHTQRLAGELARRGYESMVATLRLPDVPDYEVGDAGERVFRLRSLASRLPGAHASWRPYHPAFPDPVVRAELRRLVQRENPDVVYAHNWMVYSYASLPARLRAPLIYVLHDYCMTCPAKSLLRADGGSCRHRGLDRFPCAVQAYGPARGTAIAAGLAAANRQLRRCSCRYLAISDAVADATRLALPTVEPVQVVPTFVADGLAQSVAGRPRPEFLPEGDYILFVGALARHKGVDLLLRAYAELPSPKPDLVLLAARTQTPPPDLPPGAHLYLDVDHASVMAAWRDCLFGVVPSLWAEPFGQVAIEALTMGRPVIASDAGGLKDIVRHEENGLLFPPGSVTGLTAALARLSTDDALRDRLAGRATRGVEQFTVSAVADTVERILHEVAGR